MKFMKLSKPGWGVYSSCTVWVPAFSEVQILQRPVSYTVYSCRAALEFPLCLIPVLKLSLAFSECVLRTVHFSLSSELTLTAVIVIFLFSLIELFSVRSLKFLSLGLKTIFILMCNIYKIGINYKVLLLILSIFFSSQFSII